LHLADSRKDTR